MSDNSSESGDAIDVAALVDLQADLIDLIGANAAFDEVVELLIDWFTRRLDADVAIVLPGTPGRDDSPGRWTIELVGSDGASLGAIELAIPVDRRDAPAVRALVPHLTRLASALLERYRLQWSISGVLADERRLIAEALHDDPIQALTAVSLRLQRVVPSASAEQRPLLDAVQVSVAEAIARMRSMLFELHPPSLDDEGLEAAVEMYLYERVDDLDVSWQLDVDLLGEPSVPTRSLAYRLTREALANVIRHADASAVSVAIRSLDGGVEVTVVDDGVGCDPAEALQRRAGHLGTASSRHLAQRASGRWEMRSRIGEGTTVSFWLPDAPI